MNISTVTAGTSLVSFETATVVEVIKAPFLYVAAKVVEVAVAIFTSTTFWVITSLCLGAFLWAAYLDETEGNNSYFAQSYELKEFPPLETDLPPPPTHFTAGCVNLGTSCWLNASLNMIADTGYFDPLLNCDPSVLQSSLRELVPLLKIAVNDLRSNRSPDGDLLFTIREATRPYTENPELQNDPIDLIRGLLSTWTEQSQENPAVPRSPTFEVEARYKPIGHNSEKPSIKTQETLLEVTCVPDHLQNHFQNPSASIDLNLSIPASFISNLECDDHIYRSYRQSTGVNFANADRIVVGLRRYITENGTNKKVSNPLYMNASGTISLLDSKRVRHDYRVRSALVQVGGLHSGHWYYVAATADEKFYKHNDASVHQIDKGRFRSLDAAAIDELRQGTIFFLEKVPSCDV